jgi:hypothetical protein
LTPTDYEIGIAILPDSTAFTIQPNSGIILMEIIISFRRIIQNKPSFQDDNHKTDYHPEKKDNVSSHICQEYNLF